MLKLDLKYQKFSHGFLEDSRVFVPEYYKILMHMPACIQQFPSPETSPPVNSSRSCLIFRGAICHNSSWIWDLLETYFNIVKHALIWITWYRKKAGNRILNTLIFFSYAVWRRRFLRIVIYFGWYIRLKIGLLRCVILSLSFRHPLALRWFFPPMSLLRVSVEVFLCWNQATCFHIMHLDVLLLAILIEMVENT